jgi:microcystin-dependent protein
MSYTVKFTDFTNKGSLTVNDSTVNNETSLTFPGRNYRGYGISISENFLHLLENFASTTPPSKPVEGQVWYDNTPGTEDLKVYDGTTWKSAGSVRKGNSQPDITTSVLGDLWVDTDNQQLYLYSGAAWVLVGPTFASGLKTGALAETVLDTTNNEQTIIKTYVDDQVVAIYSISSFIPKVGIDGFIEIKPGLNLSQRNFNGETAKLRGTAEKAEALVIGSNTISATNFLRRDTSNITNFGFNVRNDGGITVGSEGQLRLFVDTNQTGGVYHSTPGSSFDIKVNNQGSVTTVIRADSSLKVGIGNNNLSPEETLDVLGSARFTDKVKIRSTEDTIDNASGALQVSGGVYVAKKLTVGTDQSITGELSVGGNLAVTGNLTASNISASSFTGAFTGNIIGDVVGNVFGKAKQLLSSTTFTISGDMTSSGFTFDGFSTTVSANALSSGQQYKIATIGTTDFTLVGASSNLEGLIFTATGPASGNGTVTTIVNKNFVTTISSDLITTKTEVTTNDVFDTLLINRVGFGLRKISRTNFLSGIATVPIGAVFPFAGSKDRVPTGYLLCDGSEVRIADYNQLFQIIGYNYGASVSLIGDNTFKLPDLRGRFPLGPDNMDNELTVPAKPPGTGNIDAGGGSANRVTDITADTLGNGSGNEIRSLALSNIPDHTHTLQTPDGTQYYAINNNATIPPEAGAFRGNGPDAPANSQYLPRTGAVVGASNPVSPFNVMNPYLTINYIIYTGAA